MRASLGAQRLAALFAAGVLLFDFPLITLWDPQASIFGVPLLPAALFGVWALLIAATAWITVRAGHEGAERGRPGGPQPAGPRRPGEPPGTG